MDTTPETSDDGGDSPHDSPRGDSPHDGDAHEHEHEHEHCFSLRVCIKPGAVPTAVDEEGNPAYRRSDIAPFARNLAEFQEWWPTLLRSTEPGHAQILVLGGRFDRPDAAAADGDGDSRSDSDGDGALEAPGGAPEAAAGDGASVGVNWALIEDVQKEIRFGALPDGYTASLKGSPAPRGMYIVLYRAA
jgi:hypothetical protein